LEDQSGGEVFSPSPSFSFIPYLQKIIQFKYMFTFHSPSRPREHAVDGDEGAAFAAHIRKSLADNPYIVTHKEMWCDLIVSKHKDCQWITKQELFDKAKLAQWDNAEAGHGVKATEPAAQVRSLSAVVDRATQPAATATISGDEESPTLTASKKRVRRRRHSKQGK
jgi:hypothetical protein